MVVLKLKVKDVEQQFHLKIKPGLKSIGLDCASRTGWAVATSDKINIEIETGFIAVQAIDRYVKLNQFIEAFQSIFEGQVYDAVVVEESFFGRNVKTFQLLSRIGAIAYMSAYLRKHQPLFLTAGQARMRLTLKGTAKKEDVQKDFLGRLKIQLDDNDIVDAIILALCGLIHESS